MDQDQRQYPRFDSDEKGWLEVGDRWQEIRVVNLSDRGACLCMDLETWACLEESPQIRGKVEAFGENCVFVARVCWASVEDEQTRIGVEIQEFERGAFSPMVKALQVEEADYPEFDLG